MNDDEAWSIVERKETISNHRSTLVFCDRRDQCFVIRNGKVRRDLISHRRSRSFDTFPTGIETTSNDAKPVDELRENLFFPSSKIFLERIQYFQRNSTKKHLTELKIFYQPNNARSEYLCQSISFQFNKSEDEILRWLEAMNWVVELAKNLSEQEKRNRWLLREFTNLNEISPLTTDLLYNWLTTTLGPSNFNKIIGKAMKNYSPSHSSSQITENHFRISYEHFLRQKLERFFHDFLHDSNKEKFVLLREFGERLFDPDRETKEEKCREIAEFLQVDQNVENLSLNKCFDFLWSDENSAFDPAQRNRIAQNMDQPINHYWISSSHNTYLAKSQLFNPASVHCYIQALLKGARCVEIDVFNGRNGSEPEITHRNTRIRPIPLRSVLQAINEFAFLKNDFPVIISIENHCSAEQRAVMAKMFVEIFAEKLVQTALPTVDDRLPSPNQLRGKILLKDAKIADSLSFVAPNPVDFEENADLSSSLEIFDASKKKWIRYNYVSTATDLFFLLDEDRSEKNLTDETIEEENQRFRSNFWFHGEISHEKTAEILSSPENPVGSFLVRRVEKENRFFLSFLNSDGKVENVEIKETAEENDKHFFLVEKEKFDSIEELVDFYRENKIPHSIELEEKPFGKTLSKALLRSNYEDELNRRSWFQPNLTPQQATNLLEAIGEEMTFLVRRSMDDPKDWSMSVFIEGKVKHWKIHRHDDGFSFFSTKSTNLIELVELFSRKAKIRNKTLGRAAIPYEKHLEQQKEFRYENFGRTNIFGRVLTEQISMKICEFRFLETQMNKNDGSVVVEVCVYNEESNRDIYGYLLKFDTKTEHDSFVKIISGSVGSTLSQTSSSFSSSQNSMKTLVPESCTLDPSQTLINEFSRLIIYCQGLKLKEHNISKAQDLLDKVKSPREMISLNSGKAATFCLDSKSMILFNQTHFTRIYPEFSRRSWDSSNFDPTPYWSVGCQMVALNFQTPDRPMHINAARFSLNAGCGYVLMPSYILKHQSKSSEIQTISQRISIRVLAALHLRTAQIRNTSKFIVKISIVGKQKSNETQSCQTILNDPCGFVDNSPLWKNESSFGSRLRSENVDVDILYFEVITENQEFCGQSAIPISCLRTGFSLIFVNATTIV